MTKKEEQVIEDTLFHFYYKFMIIYNCCPIDVSGADDMRRMLQKFREGASHSDLLTRVIERGDAHLKEIGRYYD